MNETPRSYTAQEVRQELISHAKQLAQFWSSQNQKTPLEMCEGMAFSMFVIFDGESSLPRFDIVVRPHPDDKAFCISEGENHYENGMVVNGDAMIHDEFHAAREQGLL